MIELLTWMGIILNWTIQVVIYDVMSELWPIIVLWLIFPYFVSILNCIFNEVMTPHLDVILSQFDVLYLYILGFQYQQSYGWTNEKVGRSALIYL